MRPLLNARTWRNGSIVQVILQAHLNSISEAKAEMPSLITYR